MVATSVVRESNASVAKEQHARRVCVFIGATAGIGLATLKKMAALLQTSTFYILGRSLSRFAPHLEHLQKEGPSNKYVYIESQVSLIADIDAACKQITAEQTKVDYICMSSGGVPWQGAVPTSEGLETSFAVSYYSRIRLVSNLLPLLHQSARPHVLSILNGTREKAIDENDIGLEKSWGIISLINHTTLLMSLSFDYLAEQDSKKHIVYLHATPGLVITGSKKQKPKLSGGIFRWMFLSLLRFLSRYIMSFKGMPVQESGERHAFLLTSETYKPGSWKTDKDCEIVPDNEVLSSYQQRGWMEKAWEFTQQIWDRALASAA